MAINKNKEIGIAETAPSKGHRDIVGALNMFPLAFDTKVAASKDITYLRIPVGKSSSSLGTGQSCLNDCIGVNQPLVGVARATGHSSVSV